MELLEVPPSDVVLDGPEGALDAGAFEARVAGLVGQLRDGGLGVGDCVVIAGPRGADTLIALYACWTGGFVAAPVEAGLPPDRLRPIVEAASARAAVAVGRRAAALLRRAGDWGCFVTSEPHAGEVPLGAKAAPIDPAAVDEHAPASLHFTSGSTGGAKAVPYTRAGIDVFARYWVGALGLTARDRIAWAFPMAYAPSLVPLGSSRLAGATVLPLGAAAAAVADRAIEALSTATVLLGVPSLLASLEQRGVLAKTPLRAVVMAGEPVSTGLVRRIRAALPAARIVNLYGTTECNGIATHEVLDEPSGALLPAGRPLPFMRVRLVDEGGVEGDEGEVVVAGPTVMTGYLGSQRARWMEIDGQRHYCTGDRGRWDGGLLRLLGRSDRQVKVGGHRVELAPIEAASLAVEGVREVAVVATGEAWDRSLVGFVVGDVSTDGLRSALSRLLPSYAQPGAWIRLDALPRGPRGKVDFAALRARTSS